MLFLKDKMENLRKQHSGKKMQQDHGQGSFDLYRNSYQAGFENRGTPDLVKTINPNNIGANKNIQILDPSRAVLQSELFGPRKKTQPIRPKTAGQGVRPKTADQPPIPRALVTKQPVKPSKQPVVETIVEDSPEPVVTPVVTPATEPVQAQRSNVKSQGSLLHYHVFGESNWAFVYSAPTNIQPIQIVKDCTLHSLSISCPHGKIDPCVIYICKNLEIGSEHPDHVVGTILVKNSVSGSLLTSPKDDYWSQTAEFKKGDLLSIYIEQSNKLDLDLYLCI